MTDTVQKNSDVYGPFAALPTGEQIYDSLMCQIEPELMLENLPTLDAPYQNESEEQRAARYEGYGKAFALYRERYTLWIKNLRDSVNVYKKAFTRAAEKTNKVVEDTELESLNSQILAA